MILSKEEQEILIKKYGIIECKTLFEAFLKSEGVYKINGILIFVKNKESK